MAQVTYYLDTLAISLRTIELPYANFETGLNAGGSNACGLGVNVNGGALAGTPAQFTLLDQYGKPRTPQVSQLIGGYMFPLLVGENSASADGTVESSQEASLESLEAGWVNIPTAIMQDFMWLSDFLWRD